jgi:hypothetical protein
MTVPNTDNEYAFVLVEAIHYKVSLERVDPDRGRNLIAFTRHSRVAGDEFEQGK